MDVNEFKIFFSNPKKTQSGETLHAVFQCVQYSKRFKEIIAEIIEENKLIKKIKANMPLLTENVSPLKLYLSFDAKHQI